jgi:serine/threonine protein kinase
MSWEQLVDSIIARWDRGEEPDARKLLRRHPKLIDFQSAVVTLAYEEYCQRTERGETIDPDRFAQGFKEHAHAVRRVIEFHLMDKPYGANSLSLNVGEDFENYRIVDELGRGPFSRVYLAADLSLAHRPVVLKVTNLPGFESDGSIALDHPSITPIYGIRQEYDRSVVVMPYFGSGTFDDLLEHVRTARHAGGWTAVKRLTAAPVRYVAEHPAELEPRRPPAEMPDRYRNGSFADAAVWMLRQIAKALSVAHDADSLHLNLTPSNIIVARSGLPVVVDFTFAAQVAASPAIFVHLHYAAPEQLCRFLGDRSMDLDRRTDLFVWGVIAYELLAGVHPFELRESEAPSVGVAKQILERQAIGVVPLRKVAPGVNPSLASLIEKCLSSDPTRRPQSADEIVTQLDVEMRPWKRWIRSSLSRLSRQSAWTG